VLTLAASRSAAVAPDVRRNGSTKSPAERAPEGEQDVGTSRYSVFPARAKRERRDVSSVCERPKGVSFVVGQGGATVATPQEREEQRKQQRRSDFDRQVDNGSLVVRQMTEEERAKYAESPEAAAEREARRARKRS
jgi:hypothetical protein